MADIKIYNGSTWNNTAVRKYETKSEIITPPTTIYANGQPITTYTIKGNTTQSGTPSPSSPISVNGVGELETTGEHSGEYKIPVLTSQTTPIYLGSIQSTRQIYKLVLDGTENSWYISTQSGTGRCRVYLFGATAMGDGTEYICTHYQSAAYNTAYPAIDYVSINNSGTLIFGVNTSETLEGFKTYLQQQYTNGTPVTVWYVLQTATTGIVNEPLMKIGTYYDIISNAVSIPTTDGANSITVGTTVQPSEVSMTWTGWHDSSVKEWDGSQWI